MRTLQTNSLLDAAIQVDFENANQTMMTGAVLLVPVASSVQYAGGDAAQHPQVFEQLLCKIAQSFSRLKTAESLQKSSASAQPGVGEGAGPGEGPGDGPGGALPLTTG